MICMKSLVVYLLRMMKLVCTVARCAISSSKAKMALQYTYLGAYNDKKVRSESIRMTFEVSL